MSYYKISRDGNVIGVGSTFLRWNPKRRMFYYCDVDHAERVQDAITELLYHADWLSASPPDAGMAEEATVEMITASEYEELYALLDEGETVTIDPPSEPEPDPAPDPEPAPDNRPMTVQEMREHITTLEETLNIILGVIE